MLLKYLFSPEYSSESVENAASASLPSNLDELLYIFALLLAIFSIVLLIYLFASMSILKKAGVNPLVIFIPIYNVYVFYKIYGMRKWFWITMAISIICDFSIAGAEMLILINPIFASVVYLLMAVYFVSTFAISILYTYKMAVSFGKGVVFFLGLLFFHFLFYPILAFGKSDYVGAD